MNILYYIFIYYVYLYYSEKLYMCFNYCLSLIFTLVQPSVPICVRAFGIIGKCSECTFHDINGLFQNIYTGGLRIYFSGKAPWNL